MKQNIVLIINGINPQIKRWTLTSDAEHRGINHTFSSAIEEREGGLKVAEKLSGILIL
jgi:hypothetical protein